MTLSRKTAEQVRLNIKALLEQHAVRPADLAFAIKKHRSWMTRFLNRQRDELQLKDIDGIADFFQIAPYDLFKPSTGSVTDRRRLRQRRSGIDRRVGHAHRQMTHVASELDRVRSRQATQHGISESSALRSTLERIEAQIASVLAETDIGGQIATARTHVTKTRSSHRKLSGPDAPPTKKAAGG